MKRTSVTVTSVFAGLLFFTAVPSFTVATTWFVDGVSDSLISDFNHTENSIGTDYISMTRDRKVFSPNSVDSYSFSIMNSTTSYLLHASKPDINTTALGLNIEKNVPECRKNTGYQFRTTDNTLNWFLPVTQLFSLSSSTILPGAPIQTNYLVSSNLASSVFTGSTSGSTEKAVTPISGAAWLLSSGLLGLVGLKRRKSLTAG